MPRKKGYNYTAEDVKKYREETGASMWEARKHFEAIEDERQIKKLIVEVDRGSLAELREAVKYLLERQLNG